MQTCHFLILTTFPLLYIKVQLLTNCFPLFLFFRDRIVFFSHVMVMITPQSSSSDKYIGCSTSHSSEEYCKTKLCWGS